MKLEDFRGGQRLEDLFFGDNLFEIPDFQRDYAWTQAEVADLLGDLGLLAPGRAGANWSDLCYLGPIVLLSRPVEEFGHTNEPVAGFEVPVRPHVGATADIVDGQQRMTTLTILFACLRDRLDDDAARQALHDLIAAPLPAGSAPPQTPDHPRAETFILNLPDSPEGAFLRTYVQPRGATRALSPETLTPGEDDPIPLRRLKEATGMIAASVDALRMDDRRALARFLRERCLVAVVVTANPKSGWDVFSRVNKRGRPLLESERLKTEILREVEEPRRAELVRLWDQRKRLLGAAFDAGPSRRKDLFSHIREHHAESAGRKEERILELARAMGAEAFMVELFEPMSRALAEVTLRRFLTENGELAGESREFADRLQAMELLGRVMSAGAIDVQDAWKGPLLLYLARCKGDHERKLTFLRGLDRYLHLLLILHGKRKKPNISKQLARLNAAIIADGADLDLDAAFAIPNVKQVVGNLENALDGSVAKLVLLRVAGHTDGVGLDRAGELLGASYNIEHVLPEKITDSWARLVGGEEKAKVLRSSIGNLFITGQKLNSKLGNRTWTEKRRLLRHADVLLPLGRYVREARRWDEAAILARQKEIVAAVARIWGLTGHIHDMPAPPEQPAKAVANDRTPVRERGKKKTTNVAPRVNRPRRDYPPRIRAKRRTAANVVARPR